MNVSFIENENIFSDISGHSLFKTQYLFTVHKYKLRKIMNSTIFRVLYERISSLENLYCHMLILISIIISHVVFFTLQQYWCEM